MKFVIFTVFLAGACVALPQLNGASSLTNTVVGVAGAAEDGVIGIAEDVIPKGSLTVVAHAAQDLTSGKISHENLFTKSGKVLMDLFPFLLFLDPIYLIEAV